MSRQKTGTAYSDQLLRVVKEYREAGQRWPASKTDIARWGYRQGKLQPHPSAIIKQYAEDIGRAMREEFITDPQGRRVRVKHAAPYESAGETEFLWDDMRSTHPGTREHMARSFQHRRQQIVGDCRQLKFDIDSYNENWNASAPIQTSFDFTRDLAELELAA
jgi:hypothetical protein